MCFTKSAWPLLGLFQHKVSPHFLSKAILITDHLNEDAYFFIINEDFLTIIEQARPPHTSLKDLKTTGQLISFIANSHDCLTI